MTIGGAIDEFLREQAKFMASKKMHETIGDETDTAMQRLHSVATRLSRSTTISRIDMERPSAPNSEPPTRQVSQL